MVDPPAGQQIFCCMGGEFGSSICGERGGDAEGCKGLPEDLYEACGSVARLRYDGPSREAIHQHEVGGTFMVEEVCVKVLKRVVRLLWGCGWHVGLGGGIPVASVATAPCGGDVCCQAWPVYGCFRPGCHPACPLVCSVQGGKACLP